MTLPTLQKTWQHNVNNAVAAQGSALANNRRILRSIKDALIGFASSPWTVVYSCNGTIAGTAGDGVDRWLTDANLVFGFGTSAHSWIVLKQTGVASNFQLLIRLGGGGSSAPANGGYTAQFIASLSAGFSGGTTTARPTATDEQILDLSAAWTTLQTADVSSRWSVSMSSDGALTRVWGANSGSVAFNWIIDKPVDVVPAWTAPNIRRHGIGVPTYATLSGANWRSNINGTLATGYCGTEQYGPSGGSTGVIANELTGEYTLWPMQIISDTVGVRGRHGVMTDIWYGSTAIPSGDTYPADGSNQFVQVGDLVLPWNGGAVNLT